MENSARFPEPAGRLLAIGHNNGEGLGYLPMFPSACPVALITIPPADRPRTDLTRRRDRTNTDPGTAPAHAWAPTHRREPFAAYFSDPHLAPLQGVPSGFEDGDPPLDLFGRQQPYLLDAECRTRPALIIFRT